MFRRPEDETRPQDTQSRETHEESYYDVMIRELSNDSPQSAWHEQLTNKLKDKRDDAVFAYPITNEEYGELLKWALSKSNSTLIGAVLNKAFSNEFEQDIKKYFVTTVQRNDSKSAKLLLQNSQYLKDNIKEFRGGLSTYKQGVCGSTMLHLAAANGNIELCKFLIETLPGWHLSNDFYDNNCLHYAASGGSNLCYEYFKQINPSWENQGNIFAHKPYNYFPDNISNLFRVDQNHLLKQFGEIIKSDAREIDIDTIRNGLCNGISFVMALNLLRGGEEWKNYQDMVQKISTWKPSDGFDKIKDAFERLMQDYRYYFNFQATLDSNINISRGDRSNQLAFVNLGQDTVTSQTDYGIGDLNKDELKEILKSNLNNRNMIISMSVGPSSESSFLDNKGHAIAIVIDKKGDIHFCDPNSPYFPIPMQENNLDTIINIIFKYFDNARSIETYRYHKNNELEKISTNSVHSIKTSEKILSTFFDDRKGREFNMMCKACEADSPQTLNSLINNTPSTFSKDHMKILIDITLKNNSYRCLEVLINHYATSTKQSVDEVFNSFNIPEASKERFQNYTKNKF